MHKVRFKWVGKIGEVELQYDRVTGRYSEGPTGRLLARHADIERTDRRNHPLQQGAYSMRISCTMAVACLVVTVSARGTIQVTMLDFQFFQPSGYYSGTAWQAICASTKLRTLYQARIDLVVRLRNTLGAVPAPDDYIAVRRHLPSPAQLGDNCNPLGQCWLPDLPLVPRAIEDCMVQQLTDDNAALERQLVGRRPVVSAPHYDLCSIDDIYPGVENEIICSSPRLRGLRRALDELLFELAATAKTPSPPPGPRISAVCGIDAERAPLLPPAPQTEDCVAGQLNQMITFFREQQGTADEKRAAKKAAAERHLAKAGLELGPAFDEPC